MTATNFSPAYIETFKSNWLTAAQQQESKLRGVVTVNTQQAVTDWFKAIGKVDFSKNTAATGDATSFSAVDITARAINLSKYSKALTYSNSDVIRLGGDDPSSPIVKALAAAAGREIDRVILEAAIGNATGKTNTGSIITNIALGADQTVAVDFEVAATNTNLTLAKLQRAAEILDTNDVMGQRYIAATPNAIHSLLKDTKVGSADFNTVRALVNGELDTYYGMKFIKIGSADSILVSGNISTAVCFTEDALTLSTGTGSLDPSTSIEQSILHNNDWLIYADLFLGCSRMDEDKVVKILCDKTK